MQSANRNLWVPFVLLAILLAMRCTCARRGGKGIGWKWWNDADCERDALTAFCPDCLGAALP